MKRFFLNILIGFLTKGRVTPDKFDSITKWCISVEEQRMQKTGIEKKQIVFGLTRAIVPNVAAFVINMVIELALGWAVRTGQITTKTIDVETTVLQ